MPDAERDHLLGPAAARASLIEYGDYESAACAEAASLVRELVRDQGDDLCFVFRNFPEKEAHPHAVAAAEAAEAADLQGKFWLMHDRLLERHDELSGPLIRQLARELPIELADYDRDLASGAPARKVAGDVEGGRRAGVERAPTFFVSGRRYAGPLDLDPLLEAIQGNGPP